jgi:hypothetical protein
MILNTVNTLKPDMSYSEYGNAKGGFRPGTPILLGGIASDIRPPLNINHGEILYQSDNIYPDISEELQIKPGTEDERVGDKGGFKPLKNTYKKSFVDINELDHGQVIYTSGNIKPDMSQEMKVNVIGKRENERFGEKGGFTPFIHSKK